MERYSTTFEDPVSKREIKVGVSLTKASRRSIEQLVGEDAESMIRRCVWRALGLRCEAGFGDNVSVELTLGSKEILKLFSELRQIDSEQARVRHRRQPRRAEHK